jgi:hypothetical protein
MDKHRVSRAGQVGRERLQGYDGSDVIHTQGGGIQIELGLLGTPSAF